MKQLLISLIFIASVTGTQASIIEEGKGVLFGNDHVFSFTAVKGWVLDNQSGVKQGLHMVFYPVGETWRGSTVMIYGRALSTRTTPSIEKQVESTVIDFHNNGSPNYVSEKKKEIKLNHGKKAEIYHFSGDKWGNYEAVAYVKERDTINFLVFNSRDKTNFEKNINHFYKIVESYKNLYKPPASVSNEKLEQLEQGAKHLLTLHGGQDYESEATKAIGQKMANTLRGCTSYFPSGGLPPFTYFVEIDDEGNMMESTINPTTTLGNCFSGVMSDSQFPFHTFKKFILKVDIKINP